VFLAENILRRPANVGTRRWCDGQSVVCGHPSYSYRPAFRFIWYCDAVETLKRRSPLTRPSDLHSPAQHHAADVSGTARTVRPTTLTKVSQVRTRVDRGAMAQLCAALGGAGIRGFGAIGCNWGPFKLLLAGFNLW